MSSPGTPAPWSPHGGQGSQPGYPGPLQPGQWYQAPPLPQPPYPPQQPYPQPPYPQPPYRQQTPSPEIRRDVEAALAARGELGGDYDAQIAAGLAQRVEDLAVMRAGEFRAQSEAERQLIAGEQSGRGRQLVLAIVSLTLGVPISAITGVAMDSESAMAIAWFGIIGVNWAHAWANRRHR